MNVTYASLTTSRAPCKTPLAFRFFPATFVQLHLDHQRVPASPPACATHISAAMKYAICPIFSAVFHHHKSPDRLRHGLQFATRPA